MRPGTSSRPCPVEPHGGRLSHHYPGAIRSVIGVRQVIVPIRFNLRLY